MIDLLRYIAELVLAFTVLITPFVWAKEWLWMGFFIVVGTTLIGFEIYGCLTGIDVSLSRRMWMLDQSNPSASFKIICGMVLFWAFLCAHLIWRI